MSGKFTLLAGFTAPFSDTVPDSNQLLNSAAVNWLPQLLLASLGTVICVNAHPATTSTNVVPATVRFRLLEFMAPPREQDGQSGGRAACRPASRTSRRTSRKPLAW